MVYSLVLDHFVVTVEDLEQAIKDYQELGFRVMYGGKHAAGTTQNALIPLSDGIYIELIALTGDEPIQTDVQDFRNFFQWGYGSAGYAFNTDGIEEDVSDMKERGVLVSDIRDGSRELPDGRVLKWRIAQVDNDVFPIFLQDDTPRQWRVPNSDRRTRHENGAKSVAQVTFIIDDLHTGIAKYRAILGVPPQVDHTAAFFLLEDTLLHIMLPTDDAMREHFKVRRHAPYEIKLKTRSNTHIGTLNQSKSHGLNIQLIT